MNRVTNDYVETMAKALAAAVKLVRGGECSPEELSLICNAEERAAKAYRISRKPKPVVFPLDDA